MKRLAFILAAYGATLAFGQPCPDIVKDATALYVAQTQNVSAESINQHWNSINSAVSRCELMRGKKIVLREEIGEDFFGRLKPVDEEKLAEEKTRKAQNEEQERAQFQRRYDLIENSDSGAYTSVVRTLGLEARIKMIGAKGAVQVTQVASETQLEFARIQIKQNDEIIRLLRLLVGEKK